MSLLSIGGFNGDVTRKDPSEVSTYAKSNQDLLALLSEAKTLNYEVYFRSRVMRATETLYYSTRNLFNSKHVLTKAVEFPSKYVADVSFEYSEREATAMIAGLYVHTKKLEVSELFSIAISMVTMKHHTLFVEALASDPESRKMSIRINQQSSK